MSASAKTLPCGCVLPPAGAPESCPKHRNMPGMLLDFHGESLVLRLDGKVGQEPPFNAVSFERGYLLGLTFAEILKHGWSDRYSALRRFADESLERDREFERIQEIVADVTTGPVNRPARYTEVSYERGFATAMMKNAPPGTVNLETLVILTRPLGEQEDLRTTYAIPGEEEALDDFYLAVKERERRS